MILPFVENPQAFNFADGCDSLSISGHKFIGSPLPCGIVVAKKSNVDLIARAIEYVGALDTTITGSRTHSHRWFYGSDSKWTGWWFQRTC